MTDEAQNIKAKFDKINMRYHKLFSQLKDYAFGDEDDMKKWADEYKRLDSELYKTIGDNLELDSLKINGSGNLIAVKNGKEYDLGDKENLGSILKDLGASKWEMSGAVAGGLAGGKGKYGASLPIPHPLGKAVATIGGGIIGAAVGSFGGRTIDMFSNATDIKKELDAMTALKAGSDAAFGSIVFDTALLWVGASLKPMAKNVLKPAYNYIRHENVGQVEKLLQKAGYDKDSIEQISKEASQYVRMDDKPFTEKAIDSFSGGDLEYKPIVNKINNAINYAVNSKDKIKIQDDAFNVLMQDESLSGYITEAVKGNPLLARKVLETINDRAVSVMRNKSDLTAEEITQAIIDKHAAVKANY